MNIQFEILMHTDRHGDSLPTPTLVHSHFLALPISGNSHAQGSEVNCPRASVAYANSSIFHRHKAQIFLRILF